MPTPRLDAKRRWPLWISLFLIALHLTTMSRAWGNDMASEEAASRTMWLYVGTYTHGKTPSEGIYLLELDLASGTSDDQGRGGQACRSLVPRHPPQPQVPLRGQRAGQVQRPARGRRQRAGHRPGKRDAHAAEPAVLGRQRPLPPDRGSDGQERPGGQLRQRQRRLLADPGRWNSERGLVVHPARGQER